MPEVTSCKIALRWMPLDLTDDKSTLVQVMAWCRQATSHYLSQWWLRFMLPYGATRPQWVNWLISITTSQCYKWKEYLLWHNYVIQILWNNELHMVCCPNYQVIRTVLYIITGSDVLKYWDWYRNHGWLYISTYCVATCQVCPIWP